jgi:hypothetical protein
VRAAPSTQPLGAQRSSTAPSPRFGRRDGRRRAAGGDPTVRLPSRRLSVRATTSCAPVWPSGGSTRRASACCVSRAGRDCWRRRRRSKRLHDGTITVTVPDTLWATDATEAPTRQEGRCAVFAIVDHASGEVWVDASRRMDRWAAADLLSREVCSERFGSVKQATNGCVESSTRRSKSRCSGSSASTRSTNSARVPASSPKTSTSTGCSSATATAPRDKPPTPCVRPPWHDHASDHATCAIATARRAQTVDFSPPGQHDHDDPAPGA